MERESRLHNRLKVVAMKVPRVLIGRRCDYVSTKKRKNIVITMF